MISENACQGQNRFDLIYWKNHLDNKQNTTPCRREALAVLIALKWPQFIFYDRKA
jgi:hypothetical protein